MNKSIRMSTTLYHEQGSVLVCVCVWGGGLEKYLNIEEGPIHVLFPTTPSILHLRNSLHLWHNSNTDKRLVDAKHSPCTPAHSPACEPLTSSVRMGKEGKTAALTSPPVGVLQNWRMTFTWPWRHWPCSWWRAEVSWTGNQRHTPLQEWKHLDVTSS